MANVNDSCIGCGMCAATAPEIFRMNPDTKHAEVYHQPATPEETEKYEQAKANCPAEAIE